MITSIDTAAAIVVRRDIRIDAPLSLVWDLHTGVNSWPAWQTDITAASAEHPLAPGVVFRWHTAGMTIDSTVYAIEAPHRLLWGGTAHGITGIHLWTFHEENGQVHAHTEESWDGEPVRADVENLRAALDGSLASWLDRLKEAAENGGAALSAARPPEGS